MLTNEHFYEKAVVAEVDSRRNRDRDSERT
jgi:hypothetical protein